MGRRNNIKLAADLFAFVAEARRHVGTDKWKYLPFWHLTSHVKYYNNFNLSVTNTLKTTVQRKDNQHWSTDQFNWSC